MKIKNLKKSLILVLAVISFASCNRGYGCPTNFSIEDVLVSLMNMTAGILF